MNSPYKLNNPIVNICIGIYKAMGGSRTKWIGY
jgi:hypothetical protein